MLANNKVKVLVINPPRVAGRPVVREERFEHKEFEAVFPPLTLLYCAAQIRRHVERADVHFLDAMGYDLGFEEVRSRFLEIMPDIIVTRFAFDVYQEDMDFIRRLKELKPDAIVITRNKIIADVPELVEKYLRQFPCIDYFVTVEQDSAIHHVVTDLLANTTPRACAFLDNGEFTRTENVPEIQDLDEIPFPAYDLLPKPFPYKNSLFNDNFTSVMSSRGCPYQCTFCAYRNRKWRFRSAKNVVAELKMLYEEYGIRSFVYFDDTLSMDKKRCLDICRLMKEQNLKMEYGICTRVNHIDEELVSAWKDTGLSEISLGMESGSDAILKAAKKAISKEQIVRAFKICDKFKIKTIVLVILGLPGETRETIRETKDLVKQINPFYLQYCVCIPFPNTPLFRWYKENNLLLHENFADYCPLGPPVIRTHALSADELEKEKARAYRQFILRPGFVLGKISLTDWAWNIRGAKMFVKRVAGIMGGYVR